MTNNRKPPGGPDDPDQKRVDQDNDFIRKVSKCTDGQAQVEDFARFHYRSHNGKALKAAELKAADAKAERDQAHAELQAATKLRDDTHPTITMSHMRTGEESAESIPFAQWEMRDQAVAISAVLFGSLLLGLGWVNVAVNILGSGNPVFLENPALAWLLGAIIPSAAMALKFGYQIFETDRQRQRYAYIVYGTAASLLIAWVMLFANSFHGISGTIIWDELGETGSDWKSIALVMTQILGEITVGAALFLVADQVAGTYSANWVMPNPKYTRAEERRQAAEERFNTKNERYIDAQSTLDQLTNAQEEFVRQAIADWHSLQRGRKD